MSLGKKGKPGKSVHSSSLLGIANALKFTWQKWTFGPYRTERGKTTVCIKQLQMRIWGREKRTSGERVQEFLEMGANEGSSCDLVNKLLIRNHFIISISNKRLIVDEAERSAHSQAFLVWFSTTDKWSLQLELQNTWPALIVEHFCKDRIKMIFTQCVLPARKNAQHLGRVQWDAPRLVNRISMHFCSFNETAIRKTELWVWVLRPRYTDGSQFETIKSVKTNKGNKSFHSKTKKHKYARNSNTNKAFLQ